MQKGIVIGWSPVAELFAHMVKAYGFECDLFAEATYHLREIDGLNFAQYDFLVVTYWRYYNAVVKIKALNPKIRIWFCNTWDEKLSQMALESGAMVCNPPQGIKLFKNWLEGYLNLN
ncbi:MAG: hypothetical protein SNJ55_07000 [Chloroherpetonaceae bacterium]